MTLEKTMHQFIDRFLIREQIENYIDALNHRDWDRLSGTLCDDFIWSADAPFDLRYEGKKAFVEMLDTVQAYQYGFVFQMAHGIVVKDLREDRAKASQTLVINSNSFECIGFYYDELRKEGDGVWRFKRRDFKPSYHETRDVRGNTYRILPDPNYRNLPEL